MNLTPTEIWNICVTIYAIVITVPFVYFSIKDGKRMIDEMNKKNNIPS